MIMLKILHNKRDVPRGVDLHTLREVAVLARKYQLQESLGLTVDFWVQNLEDYMPGTCNGKLLAWIFISFTFQQPDIFKRATCVAQLNCSSTITAQQLPIHSSVLGDLF